MLSRQNSIHSQVNRSIFLHGSLGIRKPYHRISIDKSQLSWRHLTPSVGGSLCSTKIRATRMGLQPASSLCTGKAWRSKWQGAIRDSILCFMQRVTNISRLARWGWCWELAGRVQGSSCCQQLYLLLAPLPSGVQVRAPIPWILAEEFSQSFFCLHTDLLE